MAMKINKEENPSGVYVECSGLISGQDIIGINQEIADCLEYTYQLFDLTNVDLLEISPNEMHAIALQDGSIPENSSLLKVAIVGSKETLRHLDELYHTFSGEWVGRRKKFVSETFRSIEEARQWLEC